MSTPARTRPIEGPAPRAAGREHGLALARAALADAAAHRPRVLLVLGEAVLAPGNTGFVPIGVAGARNVNDQLPLYDAFAYRPWPLHDFEEPTMTEELRWP